MATKTDGRLTKRTLPVPVREVFEQHERALEDAADRQGAVKATYEVGTYARYTARFAVAPKATARGTIRHTTHVLVVSCDYDGSDVRTEAHVFLGAPLNQWVS